MSFKTNVYVCWKNVSPQQYCLCGLITHSAAASRPARSYGCFCGQASHLQTNPDQRYDTNIRGVGKNGFHLDSKEPDWSKFRDFIMGEVRYNSLMKTFPQEAEELFVATERNAKLRYEGYKKLSEM